LVEYVTKIRAGINTSTKRERRTRGSWDVL
jgi:hypothetical protein